jgi:hypothetical protein
MHERASAASPSIQVQVRIPTDLLFAVESFRRSEPDIPTRPEAVRRLLQRALELRADLTRASIVETGS